MNWIDRRKYGFYFFVMFFFFMMMRFFNGLTLSQLNQNPIHSPRIDPLVWIVHWSGIPDILSSKNVAFIIDGVMSIIPLLILVQLYRKKQIKKLALVHFFLFGLYVLIIYCYPSLSLRKYLGLLFVPLAFAMHSKSRYENFLALLRYYVCFIFVSASLWKLLRGALWSSDHMYLTLKAQHIDNIVNWPDHFISQIVNVFTNNPSLSSALLVLGFVSQMCFSVGFFTRKWDKILAFLLVLFIISDFLIMRIEYWEFLVFLPLFLYPKAVEK